MIQPLSFPCYSCSSRTRSTMLTTKAATFVAIIILTTAHVASARPSKSASPRAVDAHRRYDLPPRLRPCYSRDDCDRKAFDESGTRGRMGLGADPAHPEGPGNFSD